MDIHLHVGGLVPLISSSSSSHWIDRERKKHVEISICQKKQQPRRHQGRSLASRPRDSNRNNDALIVAGLSNRLPLHAHGSSLYDGYSTRGETACTHDSNPEACSPMESG